MNEAAPVLRARCDDRVIVDDNAGASVETRGTPARIGIIFRQYLACVPELQQLPGAMALQAAPSLARRGTGASALAPATGLR
jgi:hypothetical protein